MLSERRVTLRQSEAEDHGKIYIVDAYFVSCFSFTKMFDENSKYLFMCSVAMRWLAVRIDTLSVVITGTTAFLVIALQDYVSAPLAGLALSYSAQISGVFQYTIRLVSETEVRFISVERITHYIKVSLSLHQGCYSLSVREPNFVTS